MFIPITTTKERFGYWSHNKRRPVVYEAVYQSNKKRPIKYIVRIIKGEEKSFRTQAKALKYLERTLERETKFKKCIKCKKLNVPTARVMSICDKCLKKYKKRKVRR